MKDRRRCGPDCRCVEIKTGKTESVTVIVLPMTTGTFPKLTSPIPEERSGDPKTVSRIGSSDGELRPCVLSLVPCFYRS